MINVIIIYIEYLSIVKRSKIYTSKKKLLLFSKKELPLSLCGESFQEENT